MAARPALSRDSCGPTLHFAQRAAVNTPKLDAALRQLIVTLRRVDAEIAIERPANQTIDSKLRALHFQMRVRNTLIELEQTCIR